MISYFLCLSLLMSIMSFIMFDPIKSSFFLIFSLLSCMPLLSFSGYIWFSYFICLLFLSGVFVILVYFSSLSKLVFVGTSFFLVVVLSLLSLYSSSFFMYNFDSLLNLSVFYNLVYLPIFIFMLLCLVMFMNFSSYFLNFSGALRKF